MLAGRDKADALVVLVHGLYMHGLVMVPLMLMLGGCGFRCRLFSYPSLRKDTLENAGRLSRFLQRVDAPVVHFLCHSLGGLVVRAMLAQSSSDRPGRVLTLGTPHLGCHVAERLGSSAPTAWMVGKGLRHGLDGDLPPWPSGREVATIAGDRAVGLGRLVPGLPKPNDGTVALAETDLGPGYPRAVLPVSHSSMLLSRTVGRYACAYLIPRLITHARIHGTPRTSDDMAGHSKWANIQHRKGAQDAKRGKLFTKLIREVSVAARMGGGDPAANSRLRLAMDKALSGNVPKDTIERAIKRASGDQDADSIEEVRYEGYGPGGVAVMVDCMTDNRNRTVADVRHAFTKFGGNLGTDGSVSYLFTKLGQISYPTGSDEDRIMEALTAVDSFPDVRDAMVAMDLTPEQAEVTMRASTSVSLSTDDAQTMIKLLEMLEDHDDVQQVYSNADISDEILAEIG